MSKKAADINTGSTRRVPFTTTRRGPASVRRASMSSRLAREARQQRLAYLALFGVAGLIVLVLLIGALWQFVIGPAQPVATVNGVAIRTDAFNRYQKFESYILENQYLQLNNELQKFQSNPKLAAVSAQLTQQINTQIQTVQSNQSNIPAYTLSQMEQALEMTQAAGKIGAAPTKAQLDAAMANLQKQAGGAAGFNRLLNNTGVQAGDLRAYYAPMAVVQQNVTKHFADAAKIVTTQPWAKARHILVGTKKLADLVAQAVRSNHGATFAALAKKYSMDNGLTPGVKLAPAQRLQLESKSSAFNGGWLRDPSQPFKANQPTWITPSTGYVKPVLDAILAMKPGEVREVLSQFGWHVIQVTDRTIHHLSKKEIDSLRQQQGQTGYQTWQSTATSSLSNKVNPPDPYVQFPATTPGA